MTSMIAERLAAVMKSLLEEIVLRLQLSRAAVRPLERASRAHELLDALSSSGLLGLPGKSVGAPSIGINW